MKNKQAKCRTEEIYLSSSFCELLFGFIHLFIFMIKFFENHQTEICLCLKEGHDENLLKMKFSGSVLNKSLKLSGSAFLC